MKLRVAWSHVFQAVTPVNVERPSLIIAEGAATVRDTVSSVLENVSNMRDDHYAARKGMLGFRVEDFPSCVHSWLLKTFNVRSF
jgi:hypothetical protein